MKKISKSVIMFAALSAMAVSASAGTFNVGVEGYLGSSESTIANPSISTLGLKERDKGYGLVTSYVNNSGYDVSLSVKNMTPSVRRLFEARIDTAKTLDFEQYGKLRIAPLGISYISADLKDIGTKEFNIYYSPSLTYSKDIGYGVFAAIGGTYNYGLASHYSNSISGVTCVLPKSNGYETMAKVGYNATKSMTVYVAYNRSKIDYAGNDLHYDTQFHVNYTTVGLNYAF